MKTVYELRKSGNKVQVMHWRWHRYGLYSGGQEEDYYRKNYEDELSRQDLNKPCLAKGGKTEVKITTPDGINAVGVAECSRKENFCRKRGLDIALGRALIDLELKKQCIEINKFECL